MKKFFTLIAAMLMLSASAETLTLYGETGEYLAGVPFNGSWVDEVGNKTQVLFPAADLTDMVGKTITAITFYTEPEGCKLDGGLLDISLGETTVSALSEYITEGLTKVGTFTFTAIENQVVEMTINFNTPYVYNGGNLLFENVVVEATDYQFVYFTGMKTNYNCAIVGSYGGASTRQFLPKTTFTYGDGGSEPEVLRGDVDKDGGVSIADVTTLIDMLLSGAEMTPEADCDLDGSMSIADVTTLIDYLLSGNWAE